MQRDINIKEYMSTFTEKLYNPKETVYSSIIIGADIGGTNTNIGIFGLSQGKKPILIRSLHYKSFEITDFAAMFAQVIQYLGQFQIQINKICIAAAGVVPEKRDRVKPTNLLVELIISDIQQATKVSTIILANDFEVISYGLKHIAKNMLVQIKDGKAEIKGHQAIIGAGTGFGKCIIFEGNTLVSEGGHADFAAQSKNDIDLINFIQKRDHRTSPVSWEDILSGNGIERIYQFFLPQCLGYCDIHGPRPDEIFKMRYSNEAAKRTVQYYAELYARCARNFVLDSLALGGLYIAGGIAAKNVALFQTDWFLKSFIKNEKQHNILFDVPITVIADYNVSLYGAAEFILQFYSESNFSIINKMNKH